MSFDFSALQEPKRCVTCSGSVFRESRFACDTCIDKVEKNISIISAALRAIPDEIHNGSRGAKLNSANADAVTNLLSHVTPSAPRPEVIARDHHFDSDMNATTMFHLFSLRLGGRGWDIAYRVGEAAGRVWWSEFFNAVGATAQRLVRLTGGGISMSTTDVRCTEEFCDGYLERPEFETEMLDGEPLVNVYVCHSCSASYDVEEFAQAVDAKAEKVRERIEKRRVEVTELVNSGPVEEQWMTVETAAILSGRNPSGLHVAAKAGNIHSEKVTYKSYGRDVTVRQVWWPSVEAWVAKRKTKARVPV